MWRVMSTLAQTQFQAVQLALLTMLASILLPGFVPVRRHADAAPKRSRLAGQRAQRRVSGVDAARLRHCGTAACHHY